MRQLSNPSLTVAPTANSPATLSTLSVQGTTAASNQREFLANFGLVSNTGSAAGVTNRDKVALYAGVDAFSGTGDVWALNTVTTLEAGSGTVNAHGYELDFNNLSYDWNGNFATSTYGLSITGAGTKRSTGAMLISGPTAQIWNYGILIAGNSVKEASFYDLGIATTSIYVGGTHTYDAIFNGGGKVGIGTAIPDARLKLEESTNQNDAAFFNTGNSFTSTNLTLANNSANSTGWYYLLGSNDQDGTPDNGFYIRGDDNAFIDGSWSGGGADYAEYVLPKPGTSPAQYPKGALICLVTSDPDTYGMCDGANDKDVVGIISTSPAVIGNSPALATSSPPRESTHIALAMLGRVPLRVNIEGGSIAIGDRLAASSVAGFAMKATTTARTIGLALEAYDGTSSSTQVMMYIEPDLTLAYIQLHAFGQLAGFATASSSTFVAGSFMAGFILHLFVHPASALAVAWNGVQ